MLKPFFAALYGPPELPGRHQPQDRETQAESIRGADTCLFLRWAAVGQSQEDRAEFRAALKGYAVFSDSAADDDGRKCVFCEDCVVKFGPPEVGEPGASATGGKRSGR